MLDHKKLDIYHCSVEFLRLAIRLIGDLPEGTAPLVDQLWRAGTSILVNVADGTGKTSKRERARSYAIARGSAVECGALLDVVKLIQRTEERRVSEGKALLHRMVSLLEEGRT